MRSLAAIKLPSAASATAAVGAAMGEGLAGLLKGTFPSVSAQAKPLGH